MNELVGVLTPIQTIIGTITANAQVITGTLTINAQVLTGTLTIPVDTLTPSYSGDYTVTPKAYESTALYTKGKKMLDDVLVQKVPYYETSNIYNGYTVYIAEDINDA